MCEATRTVKNANQNQLIFTIKTQKSLYLLICNIYH